MEENLNEQGSGTENPIVIGDFTPKRKFLTFVSAVNGARVRFLRDIAFLKGEKLSGVLEGVIFKITICDEGTIKFEEEETTQTDKAQRQRLLDDIDSMDITGYAQKFVVASLEFNDVNGDRCYLEVEHQKPIDKLKSLFDEDEKVEVSEKSLSLLDDLFGSNDDGLKINRITGTNTFSTYFTVISNGNIGIGTTAPSNTLDVSGTGRITTSLTTGAVYSTNITSTNIVGTNVSSGTLNVTGLTSGNINFMVSDIPTLVALKNVNKIDVNNIRYVSKLYKQKVYFFTYKTTGIESMKYISRRFVIGIPGKKNEINIFINTIIMKLNLLNL